MKYSDFIDAKYFLRKDPTIQRKSRLVKDVADIITDFCGIGFYWYNKYASEISEKCLEQKSITKSHSKFSCEIVLEFQTLITIT